MRHYTLTIYYPSGRVKARLLLTCEQLHTLRPHPLANRMTVRVATAGELRNVKGR